MDSENPLSSTTLTSIATFPMVVLNNTILTKSYRKNRRKLIHDNENKNVNQLRTGIQEIRDRVIKKTTAISDNGIHTSILSMINPKALLSVNVMFISPNRIV